MIGQLLAVAVFAAPGAGENLRTCLDGRYRALCDHRTLTPSQRQAVEAAERKANLRTCLDGRYPALCERGMLTDAERIRVEDAERKANLKVCLDGRYVALCNHALLTVSERTRVETAERAANLRICLDGHYSALCDHGGLSSTEKERVAAAERKAVAAVPIINRGRARVRGGGGGGRFGCEDGHWLQSNTDGEILVLEDGSVWEVSAVDVITSVLWLPVSDIAVCDDKLINIDDGESVEVRRLR